MLVVFIAVNKLVAYLPQFYPSTGATLSLVFAERLLTGLAATTQRTIHGDTFLTLLIVNTKVAAEF
jgi:hypothetical protein